MKHFLIIAFWILAFKTFGQPTNESLTYDLINQIVQEQKVEKLNRKADCQNLIDNDGKIIFDFNEINEWFFNQKNTDTAIINELKNIDLKELLIQVGKNKNLIWKKEFISRRVELFRPKKFPLLRHSKQINSFKPKYTISAPLFDKNKKIAIVYFSEYNGPESSYSEIRIYYLINGKWIHLGEKTLTIS